MGTNISEEPTCSIFSVEKFYLKVEAVGSSEMIVPIYQTTLCLSLKTSVLRL
jgi:hypothetical protein